MAEPINYLTNDDVRKLRELYRWVKDKPGFSSYGPGRGGRLDNVEHEETTAPELYVARTPPSGIPALEETGTGTDGLDDEPGYAECEVYQLLDDDQDSPRLYLTGNQKRVYNITTITIPGDEWILVARDKWGSWYVVTGQAAERYARITAVHGGGRYSGVAVDLGIVGTGSPPDADDYGIEDVVPTVTYSGNLYRAESSDFNEPVGLPRIKVGQNVKITPSAASGKYIITPWGSQIRYNRRRLVAVYCDGGNLVNVYEYERWHSRELCITPGVAGEAET